MHDRPHETPDHLRILIAIIALLTSSTCFAEFPAWIEQEKIRGTYDFHHVDDH